MIVKNLTKKTVITTDLKFANSFVDRMLGLLSKSNSRSLLFETRFGIHTFFLKEPIDILILDKDYRVQNVLEDLKPNRLVFYNPKNPYVLELPKNSIRNSETKKGDRLKVG